MKEIKIFLVVLLFITIVVPAVLAIDAKKMYLYFPQLRSGNIIYPSDFRKTSTWDEIIFKVVDENGGGVDYVDCEVKAISYPSSDFKYIVLRNANEPSTYGIVLSSPMFPQKLVPGEYTFRIQCEKEGYEPIDEIVHITIEKEPATIEYEIIAPDGCIDSYPSYLKEECYRKTDKVYAHSNLTLEFFYKSKLDPFYAPVEPTCKIKVNDQTYYSDKDSDYIIFNVDGWDAVYLEIECKDLNEIFDTARIFRKLNIKIVPVDLKINVSIPKIVYKDQVINIKPIVYDALGRKAVNVKCHFNYKIKNLLGWVTDEKKLELKGNYDNYLKFERPGYVDGVITCSGPGYNSVSRKIEIFIFDKYYNLYILRLFTLTGISDVASLVFLSFFE